MEPAALLTLIATYRYLILVPAAFVWGLLVCMLVGVAIRLELLHFFPAYFCVMAGELIGDMLWYSIGYRWGERFVARFGRYVGISASQVARAETLFRKYNQRILLSSKLTNGFGFSIPILFTAGMSHLSFFRFMHANLTGQFFWSGGLIAVGYFFGDWYLRVNEVSEKVSIIALAALLILTGLGFARYIGKRMTR